MSEKLDARLKAVAYHRPSSDIQDRMSALRKSFQALVIILDAALPEGREKSLAFTALEESAMWAMKALTLTDPGAEQVSP